MRPLHRHAMLSLEKDCSREKLRAEQARVVEYARRTKCTVVTECKLSRVQPSVVDADVVDDIVNRVTLIYIIGEVQEGSHVIHRSRPIT